jgi:hypothetical protein
METKENEKLVVVLKPKDFKKDTKVKEGADKEGKKTFDIKHANNLLKLPNSQWELADEKFVWNGTEIAKKAKEEKK